MTDEHPIYPIKSHRVWRCPWYAVRQDRIHLPDGSEGIYNVVELADAVWVVPVTTEGEIILLWHYRYPLRTWGWELPSGGGVHSREEEPASRSTGTTRRSWRHSYRLALFDAGQHHQRHRHRTRPPLYLATGVTLGSTEHEPAEVMTVHTFPATEVYRMARGGEIHDGVGVLALLLAEPFLDQRTS